MESFRLDVETIRLILKRQLLSIMIISHLKKNGLNKLSLIGKGEHLRKPKDFTTHFDDWTSLVPECELNPG